MQAAYLLAPQRCSIEHSSTGVWSGRGDSVEDQQTSKDG